MVLGNLRINAEQRKGGAGGGGGGGGEEVGERERERGGEREGGKILFIKHQLHTFRAL